MAPGRSHSQPRPWWLGGGPLALAACFTVWAAWFVYRTSFVVEGTRYFSLFDDAMISMAYARNLVEGHGLNWARWGAPVEGFTSPLWTFAMIPANAVGLPLALRALPVQGLAFLLLLANLALVAVLTRRHFAFESAATWMPACFLTAFYYPLDYWSLLGMETALQAVLVTAAVLLAGEIADGKRGWIVPLGALSALAYLARMDMAILTAVVAGFLVVSGAVRRADRRRWLVAGLLCAAAMAGYQVFRWLYFHDHLPNTYYLKLTGVPFEVRLLRGLDTYAGFLRANAWAFLLLFLAIAPAVRWRPKARLPVAVFAAYSAYSVWVGGDAWEFQQGLRANRFQAFVMPLLFVAGNGGLNFLLARWRAARRGGWPASWLAPFYAIVAPTALVFATANGLVLAERGEENWKNLAVTSPPLLVTGHEMVLSSLVHLQRIVLPGAKVATCWAGIPAFFSDYRMIDIYGYSDRHVARLASVERLNHRKFEKLWPGHMKWDFDYVFRRLRPHAFLQGWQLGEALPAVMARNGFEEREGFWVREGSPWIVPRPGS
jgi:hypothetical protein